ncbi:MAG: L-serine ammonia-lyase, iron-sulfur-dependent, subunit alpha [Tissierellia bacterium]|nr:L-serine ammonia-lyase, iron-sulfur-dependent, subunit alpha [Tissierellia bacterium]
MYYKAKDILKIANQSKQKICEIVLEDESKDLKTTPELLLVEAKYAWEVMKLSANKGLSSPLISLSGMTGGNAFKLKKYASNNISFSGAASINAMAMAMSTSEANAAMGKIVAAPTAGASGILPAALISAQNTLNLSDDMIIKGMFTASAIGKIIATNSTLAGAVGGCQAECGSAAAMTAAAIVNLHPDSNPEQCFDAASFAIINILGLVCDPIAGLVEFPCALRNASGVTNALISADMALAGINCLIPFDEVIDAMKEVGSEMSYTLKETALGGLATTPTGCSLKSKYMPD